MKKFLFLVLIAIAFCSSIEEFKNENLEILLKAISWDDVKNNIENAIQWLKDNHLWEPIRKLILEFGEYAAMTLCLKGFSESTCKSIINLIKGYLP